MSEAKPKIEPYGSSRLLTEGPMNMAFVFDHKGSSAMPLGHNGDGARNTGLAFSIGPDGPDKGHALTFGRTRGGKGVSAIIPALLTYAGSMVVIDPKGENAWITAERRRNLGQRVIILDPWNEVNRRFGAKAGKTVEVSTFNPLSAIDPDGDNFHDDVVAIAEAFIFQTGSDPHWSESARELTAGLIAAEIQRNPGTASMKEVRALLRSSLQELEGAVLEALENHPASVAASKLAPIIEMDNDGKILNGKELASVRSTARTQTAFLDSASLIQSLETGPRPFDLTELAADKVTLYLVLPVDKLRTHGRWLRLILTLAIRAISRAETQPDLPVVFMLDELGTISPGYGLSMIEQSFGLMAGLGIRIWAFLQDLPQLQRDYPKSWETFISNSSIIQLLNVADSTTAKYFSEYLGTRSINAKTGQSVFKAVQWSYPGEFDELIRLNIDHTLSATPGQKYAESLERLRSRGIGGDVNMRWVPEQQLMSRPVMFPAEIIDAVGDTCILIVPGKGNYQLDRYLYYTHPQLQKWAWADPNRVESLPSAAPFQPLPAPPPRRSSNFFDFTPPPAE